MSKKPGTQFFQKMAEKKKSMFDGMQFRGPKTSKQTSKPSAAQSQINLTFTEINKEEQKPVTKDDLSTPSSSTHTTPNQSTFKKNQNKPSESSPYNITPTPTPDHHKNNQKTTEPPKAEIEVKPAEVAEKVEKVEKRMSGTSDVGSGSLGTTDGRTSDRSSKLESPRSVKKVQKAVVRKAEVRKGSVAEKREQKAQLQAKKSERETVLEEINQFTVKLVKVVLQQKQIRQTLNQNKLFLEQQRQRVAEWGTRQSLCAERQEYEEADKLQTMIEESEKKMEQSTIQNSYLQEQLIIQQKEELSLMAKQQAHVKKMGRRLKLIELQLQDDAANIKREELEKIENHRHQQELQRKKIQRLQKDISHQTQQLQEVDEIFQKQRTSKLTPLVEEHQFAEEEQEELEAQVKELEIRLKEKKGQLAEKVKIARRLADTIRETEESFREEEERLGKRKEQVGRLEGERSELENGCQKMQKTIEEQTTKMQSKVSQKLREAEELAEIVREYENRQGGFEDEMESRKVALDNFVQCTSLLKQFQEKHKGEKEKAKDLEYKKVTVTAQIGRLEERKEALKRQIPGLELQQRRFAEMKNFKAAGLKKGQIKQIQEEIQRIKRRTEECVAQEYEYGMNLEQLKQVQKQIIEEEQSLQKDLAHSQYSFGKGKLNDIRAYLQELSKATTLANREKLIKEVSNEVIRLEAELNRLNEHYQLGYKTEEQAQHEEEREQVEEAGEEPIENNERTEQGEEKEAVQVEQVEQDNNDNKYQAPVVGEDVEAEGEDDSGYVPLDLD